MYGTELDLKSGSHWLEASVLTTAPDATETITNMVAGEQMYVYGYDCGTQSPATNNHKIIKFGENS